MSLILVGDDNRCFCSCADKCVLGRIASEAKCTKEELEDAGYTTIPLDKKSSQEVHKIQVIDGHEYTLKIKAKKVR